MPDVLRNGVSFAEAVEFMRRQLNLSVEEWRAIWEEAGFIGKVATDAQLAQVLREIRKAILDILENGGSLAQFKQRFAEIVQASGWSEHSDAPWYVELVFRLHIQQAYSAGRWEQAWRLQEQNPTETYYFRYITAGDDRVRPNHAEWQGIVLPIAHAFWLTHFTPNGFNCRCHVMILTDRQLRRYGWSVTSDDDPRLSIPPDPGWEGNVGIAGTRSAAVSAAALAAASAG